MPDGWIAPSALLTALVLGFVTLQRLAELVIARRNTTRLLAQGGVEHAPGHYPLIVGLHAAWIIALWLLAWGQPINLWLLAAFALLQAGRVWVLATLGGRWTTRIVTVPGESLVARGPFRFVRHPNYVVVSLEILVLPASFALWLFALVFAALNLAVLAIRIPAEARALADGA